MLQAATWSGSAGSVGNESVPVVNGSEVRRWPRLSHEAQSVFRVVAGRWPEHFAFDCDDRCQRSAADYSRQIPDWQIEKLLRKVGRVPKIRLQKTQRWLAEYADR